MAFTVTRTGTSGSAGTAARSGKSRYSTACPYETAGNSDMATGIGPVVSRRLRVADVNVSPSARRYRHEGIFVRAVGDMVSVLIDLGSDRRNHEARILVEETISSWPQVSGV